MSFESMTDSAVAKELGSRLEQLRLEKNISQQHMADEIGISRLSYRKLEIGEAKLVNFIAALRVLGQIPSLEKLLPIAAFSPMELLKLKGKARKRASKAASKQTQNSDQLDW